MRLASIDVGSNSTRFLVAEIKDDSLTLVKSGLITTRLGQGITSGLLLENAMERTVSAIEDFINEIKTYNAQKIIVGATSAVRDAANKEVFINLVKNRTGLDLRVLSGEEEARASYQGVLSGVPLSADATLVLDVGGGSTEIIWPDHKGINYVSLPVGAVRMTEGGYSEKEIGELLSSYLHIIRQQEKKLSMVAVGGTATTLAAISLGNKQYQPKLVHGYILSTVEINRIYYMLLDAGQEGRKKIIGLQPQRADIILAGVNIIRKVLEGLSLGEITVSESDILHGLVLKLYQDMSKQKLE
ncbi:Ppx/GppA phosphatase family protein [Desulforamulus aquiferis]|uniref:Ppx/GppA family phosphatase n=1 Tax=Desulforamulus aquiferis TaxID=1397668 RepID=A0AAW7ZFB2_9FIRM|nr:Ppx/GppA family phosphatase [Desulforamulus aquiferis]MDO7788036.1 Ppx/GppA family phosphatase [Desulforamulus aquiferis]